MKIHEKNKPQQPHQHEDDIHSFSESECNDLEKYHTTSRNSNKQNYAESLQDADLQSPRMRRTNSGSSIRSDNVFGRPSQGIHNSSTSSYTYISEDGSQQNNITPQKKLTKQRYIFLLTSLSSIIRKLFLEYSLLVKYTVKLIQSRLIFVLFCVV